MPKKKSKKKPITKPSKSDNSKLLAFLATFLSIIGFIIAILAWRKDKYVMFYAKQSLMVFILAVIASIVQSLFIWIPILGWIINAAIGIIVFLAWLLSWLYALSGKKQEVPIIGHFGTKIRL